MRNHRHITKSGIPKRSLTLRLTLVFLLTGIILLALLVSTFRLAGEDHARKHWRGVLNNYAETIARDITPPYDQEDVDYLAQQTYSEVNILDEAGNWLPHPPPFDLDSVHFRDSDKNAMQLARHRGYLIMSQEIPGAKVIYHFRPAKDLDFLSIGPLVTFSLFLLTLFGCFHYVKSQLRPINQVNSAANSLSHGNFDIQVPVKREDELGQLAHSFNRMAAEIQQMLLAKQQLLIAVSHEIRSPLARIRMAAELLEKSELQQDIVNDAQLMDKIIQEIMLGETVSGKHTGLNLELLQSTNLTEEILAELPAQQRARVQTQFEGRKQFRADYVRLKILLRNLIKNALEHGEGKSVQVHWKLIDRMAELHVSDQGPGIAEEHVSHLTEAFYKADKSRQHNTGFGMGLYLCKLITDAHKGEIEIQSSPNEGTRVSIFLPQENQPT